MSNPTTAVEVTREQLEARIAELEAKVKAQANKGKYAGAPSFKYGDGIVQMIVSEKGAVQFKGFYSKFPVVLFEGIVLALLNNADVIRKFIADNKDKLSHGKDESK